DALLPMEKQEKVVVCHPIVLEPGQSENSVVFTDSARVMEKMAKSDGMAVVRQLRNVLSNVVLDGKLSLAFKEEDRHRRELLRNRRHVEDTVALERHVVLEIGEPVPAREHHLACAIHAHRAPWSARRRKRRQNRIDLCVEFSNLKLGARIYAGGAFLRCRRR